MNQMFDIQVTNEITREEEWPVYSGKFKQGAWCSSSWLGALGITPVKLTGLPVGNRVFCCVAGSYLKDLDPLLESTQCLKCPIGQHTDDVNLATSCVSCPRDTIAPIEGLNGCGNCPEKKFSNDGINCKNCAAGMFTSIGSSNTTCVPCPTGKYQEVGTENSCKECSKGEYQSETAKPFCLPCVPGKYQAANGQQ